MALSSSTFSNAGGAVSDLFAGFGAAASAGLQGRSLELKAQGDLAEASQYTDAKALAEQNSQYTAQATAIKQAQQQRQLSQAIGTTEAGVAGAGFSKSGTAQYLLQESASQGALTHAALGEQGLITEAGFNEQARTYGTMATTATTMAGEEQELADQTRNAGMMSEIGDFASSALKGAASIASIFAAPATGGLSLALPALLSNMPSDI